MAQINKPTDYFNTLLYTATGVQSVTGAGFQPDMSWVKARSTTSSHYIADAVRGSTKTLVPNTTAAEGTQDLITSFDSDGVTLGSSNWSDSRTAVIWNWLAGGSASSNTDGSITSSVSANTTSGFSVVSYTGNGTAGATVGHGIDTPKMIIVKNRDDTDSWEIYHASLGETKYLQFTTSAAGTNTNRWNDTAPTSSVFSLGTEAGVNQSGEDFIAYCFAEKKGYSKFGSYVGNGNTNGDGAFIYLGFKPAFFIVKNASAAGHSWYMFDNKRDVDNPTNKYLAANTGAADASFDWMDFNSNGIKVRGNSGGANNSGETYIYMAFAEQPLVGTNNIPATAR